MPPKQRRKTALPAAELSEEAFIVGCVDGPVLSGDGSILEDLVCGRCARTLFLALSVDAVFDAFRRLGRPLTDRHGRRRPFLVTCDCGHVNRLWPPGVP